MNSVLTEGICSVNVLAICVYCCCCLLMSWVPVSWTFRTSMSLESWVLVTVGRSSNNVHQNSCPLDWYSWSIQIASTSHDEQSAYMFLFPFMYCIFNLYVESHID